MIHEGQTIYRLFCSTYVKYICLNHHQRESQCNTNNTKDETFRDLVFQQWLTNGRQEDWLNAEWWGTHSSTWRICTRKCVHVFMVLSPFLSSSHEGWCKCAVNLQVCLSWFDQSSWKKTAFQIYMYSWNWHLKDLWCSILQIDWSTQPHWIHVQ